MGNIIVGIMVVVITLLAIRKIIIDKKENKKKGCNGDCGNCNGHC